MKGTEKQIAWAKEITERVTRIIDAAMEEIDRNGVEPHRTANLQALR